jgi:hypothetical protein
MSATGYERLEDRLRNAGQMATGADAHGWPLAWVNGNLLTDAADALREAESRIKAMEAVLGGIINDLPTKRDWLDPDLERAARNLLGGS